MNAEDAELLDFIHRSGEDGLIRDLGGDEGALAHLKQSITKARAAYESRYPASVMPAPAVQALLDDWRRSPHRGLALLQAIRKARNPDFLAMVWRIAHGDVIRRLNLSHEHMRSFILEVELEDADTGEVQRYISTDILDASLLRHLGIMQKDDQPVLDGFYALRR